MTISSAETSTQVDPPGVAKDRVESVDLLRGAVIVLMILDHCRDFFGDAGIDPTNLSATTPALFFTRWVTHFCAPTFSLLAGVSAALWGARRSRGELSRYLITRGIWLIVLEQTWENVFVFNGAPFLIGLVLWALGWSMIVLAALIYLPRAVIGGLALAAIAGHNLFDGVRPGPGVPALLWGFLHQPGMQTLPGGIPFLLLGYPLIPWAAVMAAGYAIGPLFSRPAGQRRPILFALGSGAVAGFLVLRWLNVYGDPRPWAVQGNPLSTVMSFLNCTKQPPSLLYLLMTLGPAFLALAAFDRGLGRLGAPIRLLGRVPMFVYLMQWPVAHGLAVVVAAARGYPVGWMFRFPPFQCPPGYGNNLAIIYASWVVTVVLLYYPSRWYWNGKQRRRVSSQGAPKLIAPEL
jgi:uncharacterized membrane protein